MAIFEKPNLFHSLIFSIHLKPLGPNTSTQIVLFSIAYPLPRKKHHRHLHIEPRLQTLISASSKLKRVSGNSWGAPVRFAIVRHLQGKKDDISGLMEGSIWNISWNHSICLNLEGEFHMNQFGIRAWMNFICLLDFFVFMPWNVYYFLGGICHTKQDLIQKAHITSIVAFCKLRMEKTPNKSSETGGAEVIRGQLDSKICSWSVPSCPL